MTMVANNEVVVKTATSVLTNAILASNDFARWIGYEFYNNNPALLQEALNIVKAIEAGNFILDDLFTAAQSKAGPITDIPGEPHPKLTVLGHTFEIGEYLGGTNVDTWTSGQAKNQQYHSREYFTTVDKTAPADYVEGWDNPNKAPAANDGEGLVYEDGEYSGSVAATDVDGDSLTYALVDPAHAPAGLIFNADGTYTFDAEQEEYQHLAHGQSQVFTVEYSVSDGKGGTDTAVLNITVKGTNDAPEAKAIAAEANEDGPAVEVSASYADKDTNDSHTYSVDTTGTKGEVVDNHDGTFSYNANGKFEGLAKGESATDTFKYTVNDGAGGTSTETVTVTIHGQNDAPVVSGTVTGAATEGDVTSTLDALAHATDVDHGMSLSVINVPSELPAGVSYDAASHSFTLDPTVGAYDHLAKDVTATVTVDYEVSDEHGDTAPASISWTVTGTNDAPKAIVDTNAGYEDTVITGSVANNDSDVDDGAVLTYALNAPVAGLTMNADGTYSLDAGHADYQDLHAGKTMNVVANYTVTDEWGATSTSSLTITLTGTADKYTGTADVDAFTKTANGQTYHFDFALPANADAFNFTGTVTVTAKGDVDGSNEHTIVISGELVDTTSSSSNLMDLNGSLGGAGTEPGHATVSGSADVAAGGFTDGHVKFDAQFNTQVGNGTTLDATLNYDFWM